MRPPINFLPWRQQRRQACARFWGVLFMASTVIALTAGLSGYAAKSAYGKSTAALLQAEHHLATALTAAKPRLAERQQKIQQALQQVQLREETRRWQPELENLAQSLPADAWLTQMDYQHRTLALTGKTRTFSALSAFETALRASQVFRINRTGAIQQDDQGHWQFQYQLTRRDPHDRSR